VKKCKKQNVNINKMRDNKKDKRRNEKCLRVAKNNITRVLKETKGYVQEGPKRSKKEKAKSSRYQR
jgi:hypothetical protein